MLSRLAAHAGGDGVADGQPRACTKTGMAVVGCVENGRPCTKVVRAAVHRGGHGGRRRCRRREAMHSGGQWRKASAGGDGRSQEWERTRTRCLETDVGRTRTRGCAMRDHVRAVNEEIRLLACMAGGTLMVLY